MQLDITKYKKIISKFKYDNSLSIKDYPEILNSRELCLYAVCIKVETFKDMICFHNDKEFLKAVASRDVSYLKYMPKSLKSDMSLARELFEIKNSSILAFNKEIQNHDEFKNILFADTKCSQKYLINLWDFDKKSVRDYIYNFPIKWKDSKKVIRFDNELLKMLLRDPVKSRKIAVYPEDLTTDNKEDLTLLMLLINNSIRFRAKNSDAFFKLYREILIKKNDAVKHFIDNFEFPINVSILKFLMKNMEFKNSFDPIYRQNLQKKDYKLLLREFYLNKQLESLDVKNQLEVISRKAKI